jgi:hypothetical protein
MTQYILAEIRTQNLANKNTELYRYTNPLGSQKQFIFYTYSNIDNKSGYCMLNVKKCSETRLLM